MHPLLPFRDWNACQPALGRLGAVLVAGAGDATAVRQLGFVPVHGVGAALEMARGQGHERIGFLLSPPYFPLRVGRADASTDWPAAPDISRCQTQDGRCAREMLLIARTDSLSSADISWCQTP